MIVIVEPNLKAVRVWAIEEKDKRISSALTLEDPQEIRNGQALKKTVHKLTCGKKIEAIAFRILFGGDTFSGPARVDRQFLDKFSKLIPLMPFYVPAARELLGIFYENFEDVPLIAFFETAFFSRLPDEEKYYAIPQEYFNKTSIKRYGTHGIFHEEAPRAAGKSDRKIISVVLDKQTTVAAIERGRTATKLLAARPLSISLGYTPLEGIMGRTTCGDLDPGIVFYLMKRHGFSIFKIDAILKRESGFLGLTGYDLSLREFFKLYQRDPKVTLAMDIYQNQILKYIGEGIALLEGLDSIVFSGDYARSMAPFIYSLLKKISFLGISFRELPWSGSGEIMCVTSLDSKISCYINSATLARVIYYDTRRYLEGKR